MMYNSIQKFRSCVISDTTCPGRAGVCAVRAGQVRPKKGRFLFLPRVASLGFRLLDTQLSRGFLILPPGLLPADPPVASDRSAGEIANGSRLSIKSPGTVSLLRPPSVTLESGAFSTVIGHA